MVALSIAGMTLWGVAPPATQMNGAGGGGTLVRAVGLIVVAPLLLQACGESTPQAAIDFGVRDGQLTIVNCGEPLGPVERIRVTERDERWVDVFDAADGPSVATEGVVTTNPADWGLVSHSEAALLEPGNDIRILLIGDARTVSAGFVVPEAGLREGEWVSHRGEVNDQPCEGLDPGARD